MTGNNIIKRQIRAWTQLFGNQWQLNACTLASNSQGITELSIPNRDSSKLLTRGATCYYVRRWSILLFYVIGKQEKHRKQRNYKMVINEDINEENHDN